MRTRSHFDRLNAGFTVKKIWLISLIFLVSCVPVQATNSTPTIAPSIEPTFTSRPSCEPTVTSSPATVASSPTVAPTGTPIPCDPFSAEFCISDGHFLFQRPVRPPANESVDRTYPYASTADGTRDPHHGVEFQGRFGTPVHAAVDGIVVFAGPDDVAFYSPWSNYYGNVVVIHHANDLFTLYAHLSAVEVEPGDRVKAGDKIGEIGQSGVATGSHLHFEVRQGDVEDYFSTQNPELRLLPSQADFGVMELSIINEKFEFQPATITLQRVDESNNVLEAYYVETYHPSLAFGRENAAIGDLPAGRYRITLIYNGRFFERRVEVQSGKLTQVVIVVK